MPNISQDEINKFNQTDWWDNEGTFRTLHDINPVRFEFIGQHCTIQNKKVLDVGCGGGLITEGLAKRKAQATGIDMAEVAIETARNHAKNQNLVIDYHLLTVEEMAEKHPQSFDVVTCLEMLEHVPDPAQIIESCTTLLKPGGTLFLSTINRSLKTKFLMQCMAESILRLLPKGTHDPNKFITPLELYDLCSLAGLEIKQMKGINYNPFTRIAHLTCDISVNYLLYATKPPIL